MEMPIVYRELQLEIWNALPQGYFRDARPDLLCEKTINDRINQILSLGQIKTIVCLGYSYSA